MTAGDKSDLNQVFLRGRLQLDTRLLVENYRLAPQFKFLAQIEDVKGAIRYLRANAPRFGLNEARYSCSVPVLEDNASLSAALTGAHSAFDIGP